MTLNVKAQRTVSATENLDGIMEVVINCTWANVEIVNWDEKSLKLTGTAIINDGLNDDAFEFSFDRTGDKIIFNSDIPTIKELPKYVSYEIKGKKHRRLLDKGEKFDWKDVDDDAKGARSYNVGTETDINLVIYLPASVAVNTKLTYGDLDLADCGNTLDLMSTYGHIEASFSDGIPSSCQLTSTYSFVDVAVPSTKDSDVYLQTSHGEIYTNLKVNIDKRMSTNKMFDSKIVGTINKGGNGQLNLRADYGNIYLRGI